MADKDDMQGKTADQAGAFKQTDAQAKTDTTASGKTGQVDAMAKPGAADTDNLKK